MRWCWGRGAAAPLQVGHPQRDVSLFQFDDVIDNIMRLDSVLGYINPEMQIPNTVLDGTDGLGRDGTHSGSLAGESSQGRAEASVEARVTSTDTVTGTQGPSRTESSVGMHNSSAQRQS